MKFVAFALGLLVTTNSFGVDWIAHRGNSCGSPENTIQAISDSWRIGADAVEIDVRFSTDGVPYLFHDNEFKENQVRNFSYEEITSLIGEFLAPRLISVLKLKPEGFYILDLKQARVSDLTHLVDVIENSNVPQSRIMIQSSDIGVLNAARHKVKGSPLAFLTGLSRGSLISEGPAPDDVLSQVSGIALDALTIKGRRFLDADYISALKSNGLKVFVWTINQSERARYYESIGVDGIITDEVVSIQELDHLCN